MKNPYLVIAFTEAKKHIESKESRFICYALRDAFLDGKISERIRQEAIDIIETRLGTDCIYIGSWLYANIPECTPEYLCSSEGKEQQRLYRLRWLDSLIAEFS